MYSDTYLNVFGLSPIYPLALELPLAKTITFLRFCMYVCIYLFIYLCIYLFIYILL